MNDEGVVAMVHQTSIYTPKLKYTLGKVDPSVLFVCRVKKGKD